MDFSRALRSFTDETDPDRWIKILIGGVISLLSVLLIPIPIILGYQVEAMRRAGEGDDRLPAWDDWGGLFVKGLIAIVIQLVYALPVLLLACCMLAALGGMGALDSTNAGQPLSQGATALLICMVCLMIPLGILASIVAPAATYRYVERGNISAAFSLGAVFSLIRARLGPYLVAWLLAGLVLPLVASALSSILCGLPLPWLSFITGVMGYNLFGQALGRSAPASVSTGTLPPLPTEY